MTYIRAIWAALLAFFAALQGKEDPQDIQDRIEQEAQDEINQVPDKTDADLLDIAVDTGLVRGDADPSTGASRASDLGTGNSEYSGRKPGLSFTTGH